MVGTISSLGAGSGLELQSILDQLREVDEQAITTKENEILDVQAQLDEFTVVNNKLLTMKSAALDLSLSSTFLGRTVSSADESIYTASVLEGTSAQSASVTVDRLATKSSWLSGGASASDAIVYVPTSSESTTGVTDPAAGTVAAAGETLTITFGGSQTIAVTAAVDLTMNDLVTEINNHVDNQGGPGANGRYVTASTYTVGSETFLRIETDTAGGTGEANRVAISETLAAIDFAAPTDVFQYEFGPAGDTTVVTLNVDADTTLSELVDLINDDTDNPGITASIIDDGSATNPYKLLLQADDTGEDNRITVTNQLPDLTFTEEQGAGGASLNSQVTIEGISYQRQSNSVSDVITGVTLDLVGAGTAKMTVSTNDTAVKELISSFVEAYNGAVQQIQQEIGYDEEEAKFGPLARTTIRDLPYDLQSIMTRTIKADPDGNVTSMFDLGMEFNRDGTITLDSEVLDAAIASYPDGVEAFFLGDDDEEITGLGDLVNDFLRTVTGTSGQIEAEKTAAQERIDDLELRIETETERLDKKYEILTKRFIELDTFMREMTSMSNYLTGQFDALGNLLNKSGQE